MHFSDVHFGVENYGKLDTETGLSTRLIDFRKSLTFCIEAALSAGIELAVFTGDAYKSRDPSQTHQREFARCLSLLTSAGIPVVLLTGNHDISNARGRANAMEIFGALSAERLFVFDKPGVRVIRTAADRDVQIAALPYLTKSNILASDSLSGSGVQDTTQKVVERYESAIDWLAASCRQAQTLPTIFLGHFSVSSARIGTLQRSYLLNEPEVSKAALIRPEFDYVALGHIHKFQDLNAGFVPPIVYAGSVDRIDFGERSEPKGFVLVEIERGKAAYEFIEAPVRPFLDIEITIKAGDDPTERILDALANENLEQSVVKLVYRVRPEEEPLVDERRIHAALNRAFMKVAVRKEIVNLAEQVPVSKFSEALEPIDALGQYIGQHPEHEQKREQLTARANQLLEELLKEELA